VQARLRGFFLRDEIMAVSVGWAAYTQLHTMKNQSPVILPCDLRELLVAPLTAVLAQKATERPTWPQEALRGSCGR